MLLDGDLVGHEEGVDGIPVRVKMINDFDFCGESILTLDKPGPCEGMLTAISDLDVDRLGLRGCHHTDSVHALALGERSKAQLELHFELLDLLLARLGDLFSQVLVAGVIVRPMRVPLFLKLNEG